MERNKGTDEASSSGANPSSTNSKKESVYPLFHIEVSNSEADKHILVVPEGAAKYFSFPLPEKCGDTIDFQAYDFDSKERFDLTLSLHLGVYIIGRIWVRFATKNFLKPGDFVVFYKPNNHKSESLHRYLIRVVKQQFITFKRKAPVGTYELKSFIPETRELCVYCKKTRSGIFFICEVCKGLQHRGCNRLVIEQEKCNFCLGVANPKLIFLPDFIPGKPTSEMKRKSKLEIPKPKSPRTESGNARISRLDFSTPQSVIGQKTTSSSSKRKEPANENPSSYVDRSSQGTEPADDENLSWYEGSSTPTTSEMWATLSEHINRTRDHEQIVINMLGEIFNKLNRE